MPFTELEVQAWTLYTTVVIALVGFFFNIVSLHRTKRAEEDMARPYVNIFVDLFEIKDRQRVYVIKNFGKTPAYITDITVNGDLGIYNQHNFKSLVGNMIAPGQKFTSNIEDDFIFCVDSIINIICINFIYNINICISHVIFTSYLNSYKLTSSALAK